MIPNGIVDAVASHPDEILLWTHGFAWALALRRGRIEAAVAKVIPTRSSSSPRDDDSA